ncbi:hypothetical protein MMC25_004068 [Agyrium rufum]|nr:hypothetical protein [Agyrium rufum]
MLSCSAPKLFQKQSIPSRHWKLCSHGAKYYSNRVWSHRLVHRGSSIKLSQRARSASTITPVTAVDAVRDVPERNRDLHATLSVLKSNASQYVNLSQLQLATRGLESEVPVVRIAVLGLNGLSDAIRLIRILLSDPLGEEQEWERKLGEKIARDGRGLLVRYGERFDYDDRHPLIRTISIPSIHLQQHKVEYLLSSSDDLLQRSGGQVQDLLVPFVDTPSSASGRMSMIQNPVHKTLVLGKGIEDFVGIVQLSEEVGRIGQEDMISGTADISFPPEESDSLKGVFIIELEPAQEAISQLRKSTSNATAYEELWLQSRVSNVSDWLTAGLYSSSLAPELQRPIISALRNLIQLLLSKTSDSIASEEERLRSALISSAIPSGTKDELRKATTIWAERAHTELRDSLEVSLHDSRHWKALKWWKLLWRIDDVETQLKFILDKAWLVRAEKEMVFLVGRLMQAGLMGETSVLDNAATLSLERKSRIEAGGKYGDVPPPPSVREREGEMRTMLKRQQSQADGVYGMLDDANYPQFLTLARATLQERSVVPLQALAQKLLLQTLSTASISSLASVMLYVSVSGTSMYEAGSIAAVGIVWSLRRLQRRWEAARAEWKRNVWEAGRSALREIERVVGEVIDQGGKKSNEEEDPANDAVGKKERETAREAVRRAKMALEELIEGKYVEKKE